MAIHQGAVQIMVTINGNSITIDKENFVNLKIKRYIGDTANSFTLEAFDETAYALESLLMKKEQLAPITVQYCAAHDMTKKIVFTGTCMDYQISFVGKGTLISITGVFNSGTEASGLYWFERANIEWVGQLEYTDGQWVIDGKGSVAGKTDELYTDYRNNENVCAILKFPDGSIPGSSTIYEGNNGDIISINTSTYLVSKTLIFTSTNKALNLIGKPNANAINIECQRKRITELEPIAIAIICAYESLYTTFYTGGLYIEEYLKTKDSSWYEVIVQKLQDNKLNHKTVEENIKDVAKLIRGKCIVEAYETGWKGSFDTMPTDDEFLIKAKTYYIVSEKPYDADNSNDSSSMNTEDTGAQYDESARPTVYYNPSRIFRRIIKVYSGDTGENPNQTYERYFTLGKVEDSQWVAGLDTLQSNETAAEYINRVLCKNAMTVTADVDGSSAYGKNYSIQSTGYKYYVDGNGHNFIHIDYSANAANAPTLTYGKDDSTIISFSIGKVGALAMTGNIYNEETGQLNVDEATLDELSGDVFTIGGEKVLGADVSEEAKENSVVYKNWWQYQISPNNITSSSSTSSFEKTVHNTWEEIQNLTITAEMTVWGESGNKLSPGNFVNVIIMGNGARHYSSGCYYITSMEDNISSDGYTQTCKMIKNIGSITPTVIETRYDIMYRNIHSQSIQTTTIYSNGTEITSKTPISYDDYIWATENNATGADLAKRLGL